MDLLDSGLSHLAERLLLHEVPPTVLERAEAIRDAELVCDRFVLRVDELDGIAVAEPGGKLLCDLACADPLSQRVLGGNGREKRHVGCETTLEPLPVLRRQGGDELLGDAVRCGGGHHRGLSHAGTYVRLRKVL